MNFGLNPEGADTSFSCRGGSRAGLVTIGVKANVFQICDILCGFLLGFCIRVFVCVSCK